MKKILQIPKIMSTSLINVSFILASREWVAFACFQQQELGSVRWEILARSHQLPNSDAFCPTVASPRTDTRANPREPRAPNLPQHPKPLPKQSSKYWTSCDYYWPVFQEMARELESPVPARVQEPRWDQQAQWVQAPASYKQKDRFQTARSRSPLRFQSRTRTSRTEEKNRRRGRAPSTWCLQT